MVIAWATKKIWPGPLDPTPWKHEYFVAMVVLYLWAIPYWIEEMFSGRLRILRPSNGEQILTGGEPYDTYVNPLPKDKVLTIDDDGLARVRKRWRQ